MFGSAEAEGLFRTLRARSVPGRWHLLRGWHTARRASGQRQGFPGISPRLIWGCAARREGSTADRFSVPRGKERARKIAFLPVLAGCLACFRAAAGFPGTRLRLIWGCTVRQKGGAADGLSAYSGQEACRGDGISSGAGRLPGGLPGSGRIPRYMGNTAPKQIPPPHRSCRAAGVFSCTETGRIRLRHRATWRRWDSRERRLPKPERQ